MTHFQISISQAHRMGEYRKQLERKKTELWLKYCLKPCFCSEIYSFHLSNLTSNTHNGWAYYLIDLSITGLEMPGKSFPVNFDFHPYKFKTGVCLSFSNNVEKIDIYCMFGNWPLNVGQIFWPFLFLMDRHSSDK